MSETAAFRPRLFKWIKSRFSVVSAILMVAAISGSNCRAESTPSEKLQGWEETHAGRLVIEFQGGNVAEEVGQVLSAFAAFPNLIPARPYKIERETATGCVLMESALKVRRDHCGEKAVAALLKFSAEQKSVVDVDKALRVGGIIAVPDIDAETYVFKRTFNIEREKQRAELALLARNPAWKSISQSPSDLKGAAERRVNEPRRVLEFEGLRWFLLIKEPALLPKIEVLAIDINRPNVFVYVEHSSRRDIRPKKFSDIIPYEYFERCNTDQPVREFQGTYEKYVQSDYDAASARHCEPSADPPEVFVIDSKISPHPDLPLVSLNASVSTVSATPSERACLKQTAWNGDLYHGTYLAGIVASNGKSSGFMGIHPKSVIESIEWSKGAQDLALKDEIMKYYDQSKPQVFLFASHFVGLEDQKKNPDARDRLWHRSGDVYSETDLKDKNIRTANIMINKVITQNIRPIFIVASGQHPSEDDVTAGDELRLTSAMAPQNIGDYSNVIVVTACTECNTNNAGIWRKANYGERGAHLVDLAAPGGEAIPGIANEAHMSCPKFGGTSSAAAFTAGVVAKMFACYPSYYLKASNRVKARLLLTARSNIREEDRAKAPAGTIDPNLALIDPNKSWVKVVGEAQLREIKTFHHWCERTLTLQKENDRYEPVLMPNVLRISRKATGAFLLRELIEEDTTGSTVVALDVKGPGIAQEREFVAAVDIDDKTKCKLRFGDIEDLILQNDLRNQRKVTSCTQLPTCLP